MKILGWMHNKFKQNSIEPFKNFTIGNSCIRPSVQSPLDDQDCYTQPNFVSRSLRQTKQECEKRLSEIEAKRVEVNLEKTSTNISELFHGFLTIGTLGLEPIIGEPATPTLSMSLENIAEEKAEVTNNDLKLINDELEKFLEAEAEEEESNESSGRNSHVSIITLSGHRIEGFNAEEGGKTVVCPLQGYLFGSSIELAETRIEEQKEKTSLAELFHRTKVTDGNSTEKCMREEKQAKKTLKSAKHLVKKMLKKLHAPSCSSTPSADGDAADSFSTKKKFRKVQQMFHRKIHPESSIGAGEHNKSRKYKVNNTPYNGGYKSGVLVHLDEENSPWGPRSKDRIQCHKTNLNLPPYSLSGINSSGNKEHWIKTDADYLVLEL